MPAELNSTMQKNNKIIAANWKMNGSEKLLKEFSTFEQIKSSDIIVFPPFTLIDSAKSLLPSYIKIGAQNCNEEDNGPYTGEISASMLQERGVSHVLIGHSERRTLFKETDAVIFKKAKSAIKNKLIPVICIGETLSEKKANKTLKVLDSQIDGSITKLNTNEQLIVAYEPVWAIGTGLTPNEKEIKETHLHIKSKLTKYFNAYIPILYGGSANSDNCRRILSIENVDGLLVGGASLKKHDFNAICNC